MLHALRDYTLPVLLALAVHGVALVLLARGWSPEQVVEQVFKPHIVRSTLVVVEPRPAPPRRRAPIVTPDPAPQPAPRPDTAAAEQKARTQADLERKRLAEERAERERAAAERQARLDALVTDAFDQALAEESEDLAEAEQADIASSYRQGIYERIVANWSRPPSARLGMQAHVMVELIPTGEVVGVTIIEGSGNSAFDRSVEAAVHKARRFEVPKESDLFETYFRRFKVLFKPEDLLR